MLMKSLAKNNDRFVGLFRATKPKDKISQFLTQSGEIRFGDAMEEIIEKMLAYNGFETLSRNLVTHDGENLDIDQHFYDRKNNKYYFIEQKVRDDHDSTKKRGQVENFKKKHDLLKEKHGSVTGIMYFIDPGLVKNRKYYIEEFEGMRKNGCGVHIFYGKDLFDFLNTSSIWDNIVKYLTDWKKGDHQIMDINFDVDPEESFSEIKKLEISNWKKIITIEELWTSGILKE